MASISSLMSGGGSTGSIYGSRGANIISGLASGLDTEGMIQGMLQGHKQKIIGLQRQRTMLQWQQQSYQNISNQLVEFSRKYTSFTSTSNLMSNSFFNNSVTTTPAGTHAGLVSATGKSSSTVVLNGVAQLATAARKNSSASSIDPSLTTSDGKHTVTGGSVDMDQSLTLSKMSGSMTLTYGNQKITLDFGELEDFSKAGETDLDMDKFKAAVEKKLSEVKVNDPKGNQVSASSVIDVKVQNNTLTFSDKSNAGNEVLFSSATGDLGKKIPSGAGTSSMVLEQTDVVDRNGTKGKYLSNKSFTVTFNGQEKTIKLGEIKADSSNGNDWNKATQDAMQKALDDALGAGKVTVAKPENGKGFAFSVGDGNTFSIREKQNGLGEVIFGAGKSQLTSYLDTSQTLGDLGGFDPNRGGQLTIGGQFINANTPTPVPVEDRVKQSDGTYTDSNGVKLDKDGYRINDKGEKLYEYTLEVNGKEYKFDQDTSLNRIFKTINDDPESGVEVNFSQLSNQFVFTSKETGAAGKVELGGALSAIFTKDAQDQAGQDAVFQATVNGETKVYTRSSNSFEVDGMTINFNGTFNNKKLETEGPIDPSKMKAEEIFEKGDNVTFTTKTDTEPILKAIKEMVDDYNKMVTEIKNAFSDMPLKKADGSKGGGRYEPLTEDEKKDMSESEIQAYEEKAKTGILFMDRDLSNLYSDLRGAVASSPDAAFLRSIGLETNYEEGLTTIKLDENKLKEALENNLDGVRDVFTKSKENGANSDGLMASLNKVTERYARTTGSTKGILIERAGSKYAPATSMDNIMLKRMEDLDKQISKIQDKMSDKVDFYTKRFTKLEVLINRMNSQSAALAQFAGGGM